MLKLLAKAGFTVVGVENGRLAVDMWLAARAFSLCLFPALFSTPRLSTSINPLHRFCVSFLRLN